MNALRIDSSPKRGAQPLTLAATLSAACLFAGVGGSLAGMLGLTISWRLYAPGLTVIALSLLLGRFRFGNLFLGLLSIVGMVFGLFGAELADGLCCIFNQISSVIGGHIARNLPRLTTTGAGLEYAYGYLSALLALLCEWLVKNRCLLAEALLILLVAALELLINIAAPAACLCLLIASLLLTNLSSEPARRSAGGLGAWLCLAALIALALGSGLLLIEKNILPDSSALRAQLLSTVREARFGTGDSLPGGDFSNLSSLAASDETMLEVRMDAPESLYLRGFVGSGYTGSGWSAADKYALSDGADLFYWLHEDGFYGQTQLAQAALLLDGGLSDADASSLSLRHVGASREYVYAPYELLDASDGLIDPAGIGDIQPYSLKMRGCDGYSLSALPNQVKRYTALTSLLQQREGAADATLERYLINESHYNSFVYAHFLAIPEDSRALLAELLGEGPAEGARLDYGAAKQRILSYLEENISYSEIIAPHAPQSDFLEEFLAQTRAGYDVHYASAAALMMRYFGIPARYVEGYLITPEAAEAAAPGEAILLDGGCAHAWCEIYQDGIGWIPFETAPKYLNLMEQADVLLAPEATNMQPSSAPEQTHQQENSLDMEEDVFDEPEDEDEKDENTLPSGWTRIAELVLLLALLLALIFLLLHHRRAIALLKQAITMNDRKKATVNLYTYLYTLMGEIYRWPDCVAPSGFTATVRADFGEDACLKYQDVVRICQAAAFDRHGVLEEDYQFVYAFVRKTARLLSRRAGFARRLYLRYIRNLI